MDASTGASSSVAADSPTVRLLRPRVWSSSGGPATYACALQPTRPGERRRAATASGDKAQGVCIWDLDELLGAPSTAAASVKLEGSSSGTGAVAPRAPGLLAVLPNHLSSVNVVRWEPVLGRRLASGSDLNTQSIIIWRLKEPSLLGATGGDAGGSGSEDQDGSSQPFGLARSSSSGPALGRSDSDAHGSAQSKAPANREAWVPALSLHGQGDIQDLCWGPVGLRFRDEESLGERAGGLVMETPSSVAARLARGQGAQVLASCSLDTSVVVWSTDTGDRHVLKGHSAWVIGLAFDPLGAVLATQSTDGFIWLWSTSTFQLLRKIRAVGLPSLGPASRPRTDVHRTVAMARMSWTPDGAALVCCRGELPAKRKVASATNPGLRHVSVVLNRKRNFAAQCVFSGHTERTTVSAFCPLLFKTKSATPAFFGVLAIGSHDCGVSLWSTRSPRPLLLLAELASEAILDLAWSADGRTLVVASHDGSICVVDFGTNLTAIFDGTPATETEHAEHLRVLYGATTEGSALTASEHALPSGPEALALAAEQASFHTKLRALATAELEAAEAAQARRRAELEEADGWGALPKQPMPVLLESMDKAVSLSGPSSASASAASIKSLQTELRRADGKRRIVPVAVAADPTAALNQAPQAVRSSSSTAARVTVSNASANVLLQLTSAAVPTLPGAIAGAGSDAMDESTDLFAGTEASISAAHAAAAASAKRKRLEEERKTASAAAAAAQPAAKKPKLANGTPSASATAASGVVVRAPRIRYVLPPPARLNRWLLALAPSASPAPEFVLPSFPSPSPSSAASTRSPSQWEFLVTDSLGRAVTPSSASTAANASLCTTISAFAPAASTATAAAGALAPPPSRTLVWEAFVPLRILLARANGQQVVCGCVDTSSGLFYLVRLSSASGRALHPPVLLTAAPFAITVHTRQALAMCLVLTCDGLLRVYDMDNLAKKLVTQCSVRSMLAAVTAAATAPTSASKKQPDSTVAASTPAPTVRILSARLNTQNQPCVALSTHQSFVYDSSFESWSLVPGAAPGAADAAAVAHKAFPASEMRSTLHVFERTATQEERWQVDNASTLPTPPHAPVAPSSVTLAQLSHVDARARVLQTVAHLEATLAAAAHTDDATQYRQALTNYVAKLVSLYPAHPSSLAKLTELWRELSGPSSSSAGSDVLSTPPSASPVATPLPPRWQPFILGLSKRALLAALLPLLRTNASLAAAMQAR